MGKISWLINASLRWEKELMRTMDDEASHNGGVMEHLANKKLLQPQCGGRIAVSRVRPCKSCMAWGEFITFFPALESTNTISTTHEGKKWSLVYAIVLRFIKQGVAIEYSIFPLQIQSDFVGCMLHMAEINTWTICNIAATSFLAKWSNGRSYTGEEARGDPQWRKLGHGRAHKTLPTLPSGSYNF